MSLSSPPKLPTIRTKATRPTGLRIIPKTETMISGPGEPPEGFGMGLFSREAFVSGKTSKSEWPPYWGFARIFKNPRDPRIPPFFGGSPDWFYQSEQNTLFGISGSTNVDFVIHQAPTIIGVRVFSERYHVYTSSEQQAYDEQQKAALEAAGVTVFDLYEDEYLNDPSGQNVIIACKRAIGRLPSLNPLTSGTALRASKMKTLG